MNTKPIIPFTQPEDPIVGQPSEGNMTSQEIRQGHPDTCAIRSQEIVLRDFGIDVDEETLIEEAVENGWYCENGTKDSDVGRLLELHGVQVTRYVDAGINDLVDQLEAGKKVIVGVDAGELWDPDGEYFEDFFFGENADHALIVSGVDASDPDNVKVIVTDPGTGEVAKAYPLEQFMDAWEDADNCMVVTNEPSPDLDDTDYHLRSFHDGHSLGSVLADDTFGITVPGIGDTPYDFVFIDDDGDGWLDTLAYDSNGDGVADTYEYDFNEDGIVDAIGYDSNGDGILDKYAML